MNQQSLYETTATYTEGTEKGTGTAKIEQDGGLEVYITNPINNKEGTNPAQLVALSVVSCFSLHLNDIEARDNLPKTGSVRAKALVFSDHLGYKYGVTVEVDLPDIPKEKALEIVELLKLRCPTTKLFKESSDIVVELID